MSLFDGLWGIYEICGPSVEALPTTAKLYRRCTPLPSLEAVQAAPKPKPQVLASVARGPTPLLVLFPTTAPLAWEPLTKTARMRSRLAPRHERIDLDRPEAGRAWRWMVHAVAARRGLRRR